MGEDLSTGIKIAITLVILCSIVAIVFALLFIMKNITTTGANDFQASVEGIQNLYWDDYNQKTVTGNTVQTYLKMCNGKNISCVVRTTRSKDIFPGGVNYGVALNTHQSTQTMGSGSTVYVCTTDIQEVDEYMLTADAADTVLKFDTKNSCYRANIYHPAGTTELVYRTGTKSALDNTSTIYINPLHDYNAYLIKDATNAIVGVFFDQKG